MQIYLIAVGKNLPQWIEQGFSEYAKRLPANFKLNLIEISAQKRSKNSNVAQILAQESSRILEAIPAKSLIVALDERGTILSTPKLAMKLQNWQENFQSISLLIGGPDGLSKTCLDRASFQWSLSELTLPHHLVRIVVAEQLYRAWSILQNHPYHRD
jgi:23S rRNA (pseudouridine1915-N3)-methyltransferase